MSKSTNDLQRKRLIFGLALLMLAVYSLLSLLDANRAAQRLADTQADVDETAQKLAEIQRLRTAPKVAALQLEAPAEIVNRIAAARKTAGLPQSSLLQQQPLDPQRIGRTDFQQRSTTIELAPATIMQILKFCDALRDEQTGTIVRDIRLTQPETAQVSGDQEKWETEMTLTQMIFSPTSQ